MDNTFLAIIWIGSAVFVYTTAKKKNRNTIFWGVVGLILGPMSLLAALFIRADAVKNAKISKAEESEWQSLVQNLRYKHFYDGTGLAVDPQNQKLHLASYFEAKHLRKTYDFSQVKQWRYNISYGRNQRLGDMRQNKQETGLFITVKDIDTPDWQISFPYYYRKTRDIEIEMKKWMEILDQMINEGREENLNSAPAPI